MVIVHPRTALDGAADAPSLRAGLATVVVAGVVSAVIDLLATLLAGGGTGGLVLSLLVPVVFLVYWLFDALLVDAGARLSGAEHRRRAYMAVSGMPFTSLIAYALLLLAEAAATRWAGSDFSSGLAWLSLPLLAWFVGLMAVA